MVLFWLRKPCKQFIVFSDSLSALQAIKNFDVDNHLVMHIVGEHLRLEKSGKHVELCWIPSHIGITGNEKADEKANFLLWTSILALVNIVVLNGKSLGTPAHQTNYMQLF